MAARRGKSQARRNGGNSGGLPGWAWLVLGVVITIIVVVVSAARVVVPIVTGPVCRPRVIAVLRIHGPVRIPTGVDTAIDRRGVIRRPWPRVSGTGRLIRHHIPLASC